MRKISVSKKIRSIAGFTLIEMMLVIVVVSILIWASVGYIQQRTLQMRIDRTSLQMQQILNAGMAYYVTHGNWPASMDDLRGTYLPPITMRNPWNQEYHVVPYSQPGPPANLPMLYVYTAVTQSGTGTGSAAAAANVIAGSLPISYTTEDASSPPAPGSECDETSNLCYVVASVNIPGQELSNAKAVNFAGLYHHGGCVPVPQCPKDPTNNQAMVPQVMVVPASVSGTTVDFSPEAYAIVSFAAYATGSKPNLNTTPPRCSSGPVNPSEDCSAAPNIGPPVTAYWRACLKVTTERGKLPDSRSYLYEAWGREVTLLAITRCAPASEPAGSSFSVFSN